MSKTTLKTFTGERFGLGVVTDPEVRVPCPGRPGITTRCARLECDCGNVYLAELRFLIHGQRKSCGCARRGRRRSTGGKVYPNKGGYTVWVYVGWHKTRAEAEDIARRARSVVLPAIRMP